MSTHTTAAPTQTAAKPAITASPAVLLQRTCNCGQHTLGGEECDDCKEKKLSLHRRATNSFSPRFAPAIVHDVLRSSGQPLDRATRAFMEPRFGHDFGHVRIHIDSQASESARAVNALAYTVNDHIAFQAGSYDPRSQRGQRLLAHELTHVVQNRNHSSQVQPSSPEISNPADASEREATNVAERVLRNETAKVMQTPDSFVHRKLDSTAEEALIGLGIGAGISLVGGVLAAIIYEAGGSITEKTLQKYLMKLDETNKIEGAHTSDIKARRIVDSWAKGETKFVLSVRRRALLVLEMLEGHVSGGDKDGIMNVLERSADLDLDYIFGAGGVSHQKLIAALDGWKDEVRRFYKRRYKIDDIYQKDSSNLKASSLGPIQPGDEIPKDDEGNDFDPLKHSKMQTKPVEKEQSDKWVTQDYGAYLSGDKASGMYIQEKTSINPLDPAQFSEAVRGYCDRRKAEGWPQEKYESCLKSPAAIVGLQESAKEAGKEQDQIYVNTEEETATTRLHEALHAYSHPALSKLPHSGAVNPASEGMTEFFTRQIAKRHNVSIATLYQPEFQVMEEFAARFGEQVLAQVYFQGKIDLLCQSLVGRFGTGAYTAWATAMSKDSCADALKVMQGPKPAKTPDFSECPNAD